MKKEKEPMQKLNLMNHSRKEEFFLILRGQELSFLRIDDYRFMLPVYMDSLPYKDAVSFCKDNNILKDLQKALPQHKIEGELVNINSFSIDEWKWMAQNIYLENQSENFLCWMEPTSNMKDGVPVFNNEGKIFMTTELTKENRFLVGFRVVK